MTDTNTGVVVHPQRHRQLRLPGRQDPPTRAGSSASGFANYASLLTDPTIRDNFLPITIWTFAFAFLTVFTTFALGLLLAIVMSDRRMKGQKYYRVLLILPYALPIFLTAILWKGMLNVDFGIINQILPGQHQLARRPDAGPLLGALREPLDRLPVLPAGLHRGADRHPRRPEGGGLRRRRQRLRMPSAPSSSRC